MALHPFPQPQDHSCGTPPAWRPQGPGRLGRQHQTAGLGPWTISVLCVIFNKTPGPQASASHCAQCCRRHSNSEDVALGCNRCTDLGFGKTEL